MSAASTPGSAPGRGDRRSLIVTVVVLVVLVLVVFRGVLKSDIAHFSNDGPLGANSTEAIKMPGAFFGFWADLNWVGAEVGNALPDLTYALFYAAGPVGYAKLYAPFSQLMLGLCAFLFLRAIGLKGPLLVVGAIAAALNSNHLSNACWGLGSRSLTAGFAFLALAAALKAQTGGWRYLILSGFAIGLGVMEGFDIGAIFSLYVAAFAVFAYLQTEQPIARKITKTGFSLLLIVIAAGVIATAALSTLIQTQVQGVQQTATDQMTPAEKWSWATQWSLPKAEVLRVAVAGLYGYRMDSPDGGNYWGGVGQTPGDPRSRFSGAGEYAGILTLLIAAFAIANAARKQGSPYSKSERRMIWFWLGAAIVSVLLAFGYHAPFYQIIYSLPYFSTIRNPIKFMHPFHLSLLVLFGYGLLALSRQYLEKPDCLRAPLDQFKSWWKESKGFDHRWALGMGAAVGIGALCWLIYASDQKGLVDHLNKVLSPQMAGGAPVIAKFSIAEVAWSVAFLALSVVVCALVVSGALAGKRAIWAAVLMGAVLVVDLGRANQPWIVYYNYKEKYASNPILDKLKERSYEGRAQMLPGALLQMQFDYLQQRQPQQLQQSMPYFNLFRDIYGIEWLQHHFQYYNIQSIDRIQEPRVAADNANYRKAFPLNDAQKQLQMAKLTNARYFLGFGGAAVEALNDIVDPIQRRFKLVAAFTLVQKVANASQLTDFAAQLDSNGPLALIEFQGALPRVGLYQQWEVISDDTKLLEKLNAPGFRPETTVLLSKEPGLSANTNAPTAATTNSASIVKYAPKHLEIKTQSDSPTVLLLNDKYAANWQVLIDGKPGEVLRANYLMRGVALPAGSHTVEFRFEPSTTSFFVSIGAILFGLALCGTLALGRGRDAEKK